MGDANNIQIMAEPQMDPNVCRFIVDRPVYNGLVTCKNEKMAEGSPLMEGLFAISGIREVMVAGSTVTIAKKSTLEWHQIGKEIGTVIREKITAGGKLIDEESLNKDLPVNPELKAQVQEVFDEEINPGLASHGGSAEVIDAKGNTVFITLSGGCQGCASASQTLRYGIERILRERIPTIEEVIDVTDHSAGINPYM
ncbi:MAG: NifU family protein [Candidatus Zixiibacteriota bacterium]